jgi:hypothetical protein
MNRGGIVSLLCASVLVLATSSCGAASPQAKYGPYRGQLVDVETNKPIAGAAVIAIWWEAVFNPVQGKQEFYDAKEAVTDADGRFEIGRLDVPFYKLGVQPGQVSYFAPGYIPVQEIVTTPDGEHFVAPTIVKLRRAKNRDERVKYQRRLPPSIPFKKMPTFLKVFNEERLSLGLQAFREVEETK